MRPFLYRRELQEESVDSVLAFTPDPALVVGDDAAGDERLHLALQVALQGPRAEGRVKALVNDGGHGRVGQLHPELPEKLLQKSAAFLFQNASEDIRFLIKGENGQIRKASETSQNRPSVKRYADEERP